MFSATECTSVRNRIIAIRISFAISALIWVIASQVVMAGPNLGFPNVNAPPVNPILGSSASDATLPTPANISTHPDFLVEPDSTSHSLYFGDWTLTNDGMIVGGFGDIGQVSYKDDLTDKGILQRQIVDSAGNTYLQQIMAGVEERSGVTNTYDDVGLFSESFISMNGGNNGGISSFQGIRCIGTCYDDFEAMSKIRTGDFEYVDEKVRLTQISFIGAAPWAAPGTLGFTTYTDFKKAEWQQGNTSLGDYWNRLNETFDRQTTEVYGYANLRSDGKFDDIDAAAANLLASASKPSSVVDLATAKDYIQRYVEYGYDLARGWREGIDENHDQVTKRVDASGAMVKKGSATYNNIISLYPNADDHTVYWEDGDTIQEYMVDKVAATNGSDISTGFIQGHYQILNYGNPELDPFRRTTAPLDDNARYLARYGAFYTWDHDYMTITSADGDPFQLGDGTAEVNILDPYPQFGDPWPAPSP